MLTFSLGAKSVRAPSEAEVELGTGILIRNFIKVKKTLLFQAIVSGINSERKQ